jgi:hypothetical protein
MRIKIVAVDPLNPSGAWRICYTKDGSEEHNHRPLFDVRVYVPHRRRDANRANLVPDLVDIQAMAGISTSKIYSTLQLSDPATLAIPQDISNRKKMARTKLLANQTSAESLFSLLDKHNFYYKHDTDPSTKRLRYLLWAHPDTTKLARQFMDVMVMDCAYNTNKFRMSLLNVIVLTGMNTILPFAHIWMPGESEPDYNWALSTLRTFMNDESVPMPTVNATNRDLACTNASDATFPTTANLLCRWHIRRNALAQAKKKLAVDSEVGATALMIRSMMP